MVSWGLLFTNYDTTTFFFLLYSSLSLNLILMIVGVRLLPTFYITCDTDTFYIVGSDGTYMTGSDGTYMTGSDGTFDEAGCVDTFTRTRSESTFSIT